MSTAARTRRRLRGSRGQSLAEFAIIMPVMMMLVFGVIDFGMGLRSYVNLTQATREGARFGSVGNPAGTYPTNCNGTTNTTVIGRVCVTLNGLKLVDVQSISVTYPTGTTPGNNVVVSANYRYRFITPMGAIAHFFTGGVFPSYLDLSSSTIMRLE